MTVSGQIAYPFLTGLTLFQPMRNYGVQDLIVRREAAHPVWEGVAEDQMTFRRGVAGFYGRVWHEAPHGATVMHALGPTDPSTSSIRSAAAAYCFTAAMTCGSSGGTVPTNNWSRN